MKLSGADVGHSEDISPRFTPSLSPSLFLYPSTDPSHRGLCPRSLPARCIALHIRTPGSLFIRSFVRASARLYREDVMDPNCASVREELKNEAACRLAVDPHVTQQTA